MLRHGFGSNQNDDVPHRRAYDGMDADARQGNSKGCASSASRSKPAVGRSAGKEVGHPIRSPLHSWGPGLGDTPNRSRSNRAMVLYSLILIVGYCTGIGDVRADELGNPVEGAVAFGQEGQ